MTGKDTGGRNDTVLIVDDDKRLADLFAEYLSSRYETRTVYNGQDALNSVDREVDVIILDRRMNGMSGDTVLRTLRDRGFSQPTAMVTAVHPTSDVLELPTDIYLIKPATKEQLVDTVEALSERRQYDPAFREYFSAVSKRAAIESTLRHREIETSEAGTRVEQKIRSTESEEMSALTEAERNRVFPDVRGF